MLRTSGHEDQHTDNTHFDGQDLAETASTASEKEARNLSFVPSNDDVAPKEERVAVILNGDEMPVDDSTLLNVTPDAELETEEAVEKKGLLKRFFNRETLKDVAAGMVISGAARYAFIGGGVLVGVSGLPIALGSALAAGVARTAWTVHKERKAYEAETGEKVSFMDWARKLEHDEDGNITRDNSKKYRNALLASTAFATLGSTFMTYAVPHIEQWAAPVLDRVMKSETVAAIGGFFAAAWKDIVGDTTPPAPAPTPKVDAETIARGTAAFEQMMKDHGVEYRAMTPEDVQRRIEEAHAAVNASPTISPDAIQRRVEEAHAAVTSVTPSVSSPILSISDKLSVLAQDPDLSQRWQGVLARAVEGNAQAQKDVASALLNGTHGFDKNPTQAAELYRAAADAGNMQARADLAYMQFHGLGGIKADTRAALETLRENASGNRYVRTVLGNLTGENTLQRSATSEMQRAVEATVNPVSAPVSSIAPVPVNVTAEGQIPDGATLDVTWNQNAEGVISGIVKNAPAWLRDGMVIDVPTVQVK